MKLILFRHGRTEANERRLYCGSTDLPLSEGGRRELWTLRASGLLPPLDGMRVLTSGACRCEETLFALYGVIAHETEPAFREMDFGDFEMRSYEELKHDPAYIAWISGDNETNICPNGESGEQMTARVLAALERLHLDGRPTAVFTHGGPIAAILGALFPADGKNRYQWQPEPGRGCSIDTGAGTYTKI